MPELLSDPLVQIALGVSLIFGLGLVLAFPFSKAPAKAHAILVLALSGSLVFPFFYTTVHWADWGLLPSFSPSPVQKVSNTNQDLVRQITSPNKTSPLLENRSDQSAILDQAQIPLQDDPIASDSPSLPPGFLGRVFSGAQNLLNSLETSQNFSVSALLTILYWGWGLWTVFSLFLLAITAWATYRLAKTGNPLEEGSGLFLKELAGKIGLSQAPCLLENSTVRTPAVLGLHRVWATILIPKGVAPQHYSNGVFFHELAHLKRNDPLWNLLASFATAVFPWNPLAYVLRKNIHRYAEMACDDWAVECGTEPEKYVHELLSLIDPESPPFPALLSVASGFNELTQRLTRLKTGEIASPELQKTWVLAWAMVLPCLMVLSFLQPGSNPVHASELKSARPGNSPLEPAQDNPQIFHPAHSITVLQVRSGGKPSPRTKVWMEILDQDQYLFLGPNLTDENGCPSGKKPSLYVC
jgi:beta-lactamase regulating signal transducer with metallopeptidase domain